VHFIGLPEGFFPMAETALYLALAPKSNTVGSAYGAALRDVQETRNDPVPLHLRNAVTGLMRQMGYGKGYKYAHDYEGHVVEQQHLPDSVAGRRYYRPGPLGWEARHAASTADNALRAAEDIDDREANDGAQPPTAARPPKAAENTAKRAKPSKR
jgi:putative ATPase